MVRVTDEQQGLDEQGFSKMINAASREQHTEAENSPFMSDMLSGKLGVEAYRRYTEQLWFIYRALEQNWDSLAADPVTGPFMRPELARTGALELDLAHLGGADWKADLEPLPATREYLTRITECATDWPAGYVAHHYTRYLGDLSGGQVIRGIAEKTWGFERKGDGVRFYVFADIANPAAFKREYRILLDELPIDAVEQQRVIDECNRAFSLNTDLFHALNESYSVAG